jgi:hypothetical protein
MTSSITKIISSQAKVGFSNLEANQVRSTKKDNYQLLKLRRAVYQEDWLQGHH